MHDLCAIKAYLIQPGINLQCPICVEMKNIVTVTLIKETSKKDYLGSAKMLYDKIMNVI